MSKNTFITLPQNYKPSNVNGLIMDKDYQMVGIEKQDDISKTVNKLSKLQRIRIQNDKLRVWALECGQNERFFYIMKHGSKKKFRIISLLGAGDVGLGFKRLKQVSKNLIKEIDALHKKMQKQKVATSFYKEYPYAKSLYYQLNRKTDSVNLKGINNMRKYVKDAKKWL